MKYFRPFKEKKAFTSAQDINCGHSLPVCFQQSPDPIPSTGPRSLAKIIVPRKLPTNFLANFQAKFLAKFIIIIFADENILL